MWRAGFKWLFLIIGTTIGAGYASGRELWQFFGHESVLAIVIFVILFTISCYVILYISFTQKTVHYLPVLETLLGKKMTALYDFMIILYLFTVTAVMYAGSGAALEAFRIPYLIGILVSAFLVVILFFWKADGVVTMNALLIPILIVLLLATLLFFLFSQKTIFELSWQHQSNWKAGFIFTSLNILPLVAVLGAIGSKIKHRCEIWIASFGSGLLLGGITLIYNESLIHVAEELMYIEIPLFAILKHYPLFMAAMMTILLWLAIYTTAVSGLLGLTSRLQDKFNFPWWLFALLLTLAMLPITFIGFSNLVAFLYPLYGIANLYLLAALLFYPFMRKRSE